MWQVAVTAAAVASSTFIAKHLFSPKLNPHLQNDIYDEEHILANSDHCEKGKEIKRDGVFWFSSSGSSDKPSGSCSKLKEKPSSRKKLGGAKKKVGGLENGSGDQKKKVSFCLKKRRTCRNSSSKLDSSSSADCSSFNKGLSLGIMYMMSAGKAEMNKLTSAIDQTAQVVYELKTEFNKRKSSHSKEVANFDATVNTGDTLLKIKSQKENMESCELNKSPIHTKNVNYNNADSEYPSSVLTEEQPEYAELDQLEAELASEFQKLPWCNTRTSEDEPQITKSSQVQTHESTRQSSTLYQSGGVSPDELKNKLSNVLVKQQENQISELEFELNLAHSKLHEKEAELRALKDCVKRLTEFSLSSLSDEEVEACGEQGTCGEFDKTMGPGDAIVGMKRAMHF